MPQRPVLLDLRTDPIISTTSQATLLRSTSACSLATSLSTGPAAVILWPSAIVCVSFVALREQTTIMGPAVAELLLGYARDFATPPSPTRPGRIACLAGAEMQRAE
jgi:hypothetical protein